MKYVLVERSTPELLSAEILGMLAEGFALYGSPFYSGNHEEAFYCQAVTKA